MADLTFTPVYSSYVDSIAYDPDTNELHVRYANGKPATIYSDIDPDTFRNLSQSPSIGTSLHAFIRGNYPHRRAE